MGFKRLDKTNDTQRLPQGFLIFNILRQVPSMTIPCKSLVFIL